MRSSSWTVSKTCRGATGILFVNAFLASLLITGYQDIYGSNHAFQLVLVQKLNNPALYPHDALAEAVVRSYATVFWYGVAWLAHRIDISIVLFVLFLFNRCLLLWAGYRLGQALFPQSRFAGAAGLLSVAALPNSLFADAHQEAYTQQTGFALAFGLLAVDACLRRQWTLLALWLGLAIDMNLMFALFAAAYVAASWLGERRACSRAIAGALLLAVVVGAPGIYLVLRAAIIPVPNAQAVWQAAELSYPYHFFPQTWGLPPQVAAAAVAALAWKLSRHPWLLGADVGKHLRAWTLVAIGWYLLAVINPLWLHWRPLLHLHPARALLYWQMLVSIVFVCTLITRAERTTASPDRISLLPMGMILAVLWCYALSPIRVALLGVGAMALEGLRVLLGRRLRMRWLESPALFTLGAALFGLWGYGLAVHAYRVVQTAHWSGVPRYPAYEIAAWARRHTSPEAVFLIPLATTEGWREFRHLSQRSVFCQRKDGSAWPFAPWYAPEWLHRLQTLGFHETAQLKPDEYAIGAWLWLWPQHNHYLARMYDQMDEQRVRALRAWYRIDYWVTRTAMQTNFPTVFQAGEWKVLRVSE